MLVEALEERRLLSFSIHSGVILDHVQAQPVFLGSSWATLTVPGQMPGQTNLLKDQLGIFVKGLVNSSYFDMLTWAGYDISRGQSYAPAVIPTVADGATITDQDIRAQLVSGIKAGTLSGPGAENLYVVYLPPKVMVAPPFDMPGYNSDFVTDGISNAVHYAVVSYNDDVNQITEVSSHEIAEAVTDPETSTGKPGWESDGSIPSSGDQIGDVTAVEHKDVFLNLTSLRSLVQKESDKEGNSLDPTEFQILPDNLVSQYASGIQYDLTPGGALFDVRDGIGRLLDSGVTMIQAGTDPASGQQILLAMKATGEVDGWDGSGKHLEQIRTQLGGVRQVLDGIDPNTGLATTFVRFGNGDVQGWNGSGSRLVQTGSQLGGVQQLVSGIDPATNMPTTFVLFGDGVVQKWNGSGSQLEQTRAQLGRVRQLVDGIDPNTGLATTFVLFGNGDVQGWNGSGHPTEQAGSQLGGVRQLVNGIDPATKMPTTFVLFDDGDVQQWNGGGSKPEQTRTQLGGVAQLVAGVDPNTHAPTTFFLFHDGTVESTNGDTIGNGKINTDPTLGVPIQLVSGMDQFTHAPTTYVLFSKGDVHGWDDSGARLVQTRDQLGGVAQLLAGVDPNTHAPTTFFLFRDGTVEATNGDTVGNGKISTDPTLGLPIQLVSGVDQFTHAPTTFVLFNKGDVQGWDGSQPMHFVQVRDQLGGVAQLVAGVDPKNVPTTFFLFHDGTVEATNGDTMGNGKINTAPTLGMPIQLVGGVDQFTHAPTTFVLFSNGDVQGWDGSGMRLVQTHSQLGGVAQLLAGVDPNTDVPTTFSLFHDGTIEATNGDTVGNGKINTDPTLGVPIRLVSGADPNTGAPTTFVVYSKGSTSPINSMNPSPQRSSPSISADVADIARQVKQISNDRKAIKQLIAAAKALFNSTTKLTDVAQLRQDLSRFRFEKHSKMSAVILAADNAAVAADRSKIRLDSSIIRDRLQAIASNGSATVAGDLETLRAMKTQLVKDRNAGVR
jgi:hypothetical protein